MCGIAGIFSYGTGEPVDQALLTKMTDILVHRGPDGRGFHYSTQGSAGMGNRRLSIIDLKTGDQPIANEDSTVWIVFNGEIYNYRELRGQLKGCGHHFKTQSDTEVVIHAYEQWGAECASRFNGIFALCLWDEKKQSMYLARDHFGVKPLYYHDDGKRFLFASEIKSLLLDPSVPRSVDLDSLNLCLTFRHTPSPWTLFKGIRKLEPASYVIVDRRGVQTKRYWETSIEIDRHKDERKWIEELRLVYSEAVQRQMVSDVPIGLSLSSGVDSNTLLALMSQHSARVHTFTVGFEGGERKDYEVEKAVASVERWGAEYDTQVIRESDYLDFMESYLWHLEEPIGNESAAAYHFVARLARPKVKVLLSGQGADEPFAGYDRHLAARYAAFLRRIPRPLERVVARRLRNKESPRRLVDSFAEPGELATFLNIYSITTQQVRESLLKPEFRKAIDHELPARYVSTQLDRAPRGSMLERMTFIDARTSLPDNLLLCGDKMAMAASIEMRVPFLDLQVMDIAERIPGSMKVSWLRNKLIHKRACERWLPKRMVYARKIGFTNPMDRWLNQKLEIALNEITSSDGSITAKYLDRDYIRKLQFEHKRGEQDHQRLLFLLLSLETWNRVFQ
jgi:asparagine synthase (glutamine-hydrolysing)